MCVKKRTRHITKTSPFENSRELHLPSVIVSGSRQAFPLDGSNPLRSCNNDMAGPAESRPSHTPRAAPNHWGKRISHKNSPLQRISRRRSIDTSKEQQLPMRSWSAMRRRCVCVEAPLIGGARKKYSRNPKDTRTHL